MTNRVCGNKHSCSGHILLISLLALAAAGMARADEWELGAPFLTIWPSARAAALAGATTALTDGLDAAAWNPGSLGFLPGVEFSGTGGQWLPGFWPTMEKYDAGVSVALPRRTAHGLPVTLGLNTSYLYLGITEVTGANGEPLGTYPIYRGDVSVQAGVMLGPNLGVGLGVKFIHSQIEFNYDMWMLGPQPGLGLDFGGTGNAVACDVGAVYRPVSRISLGLALANLGPRIHYSDPEFDPGWGPARPDALPAILRFGACYTPVDRKFVRGRVMLELDKVLPKDQHYSGFLRSVWKGVAAEVTLFRILSLRAGYVEDMDWQRGGVLVYTDEYNDSRRIGLGDLLFNRGSDRFGSVSVTWGCGLGYQDLIQLDVSNDGAIYVVPTPNWRFALESRDIAGLVRKLRRL
jgi:hypothetical protein